MVAALGLVKGNLADLVLATGLDISHCEFEVSGFFGGLPRFFGGAGTWDWSSMGAESAAAKARSGVKFVMFDNGFLLWS